MCQVIGNSCLDTETSKWTEGARTGAPCIGEVSRIHVLILAEAKDLLDFTDAAVQSIFEFSEHVRLESVGYDLPI